jgi:hypothetical protein
MYVYYNINMLHNFVLLKYYYSTSIPLHIIRTYTTNILPNYDTTFNSKTAKDRNKIHKLKICLLSHNTYTLYVV